MSRSPWLSIGIDPGASGALALLSSDGYADGRVVDTKSPEALLAAYFELTVACPLWAAPVDKKCAVFLEDVHSMPGEGHVGVFSFGQAKGVPRGFFAALGFEVELISPQAWQKRFFKDTLARVDKDTRKETMRRAAAKRWPKAALSRKKDEAVAAALYLAACGAAVRAW